MQHKVLTFLVGAAMLAGVLVGITSPAPAGATGAEVWTARTAAQANAWASVTYGNGLFVAVAPNGVGGVMTSPDGITWTARDAAAASSWASVTYGNGLFVAVSYTTSTKQVMTSADGITWTTRTAAEANQWRSVIYGNGQFVAVASSGTNRVMTSPDGITWTARPAAEPDFWRSVTYGNGRFVAVSSDGTNRVMTSPDGITWTARAAAEANQWLSVTYGNGLFVAVSQSGADRVMRSPDGITWTARPAAEATVWRSVAYGNGQFVAVSSGGTNRVMTSPDSWPVLPDAPTVVSVLAGDGQAKVTWTPPASDGGAPVTDYVLTPYLNGVAQEAVATLGTDTTRVVTGLSNGSKYTFKVAATNSVGTGAKSTESDPVSPVRTLPSGLWTPRSAPGANGWNSVTYGNGLFVAVSGNGTDRIMTSPDGITWTARNAAETGNHGWRSVTHGNGLFVAVGSQEVTTSPDGITWTTRTAAEANLWLSVTYGNGLFVAVSELGTNQVMTSPDGITWTARHAPDANWWSSVTYGNGLFVAVSKNGTNRVMTSPDGITWTSRTATEDSNWGSVTYGNGLFVAVSQNGTNRVMTSPDGITWTPRFVSQDNNWNSVTYGNGLFVAVSGNTTKQVMTSADGIAWPIRATAEANQWNAVTYGNGLFVAVAIDGTNPVMTSTGTPLVPGAPTVGVASAGDGEATVVWTTPSSDGGSPITGYLVTPYIGATAQTPQTFNSTATSQTVTGLANGTAYTFRVAAMNAVGTGPRSSASNAVTPAGVPGTPTIGTATAGNGQATLTWTTPPSNGGSAITGYVVTPYIGATAQTPQTFNSTATGQTVTGLANGTAYTFRVAAMNAIGTGPLTSASNAVTPTATPSFAPFNSWTAFVNRQYLDLTTKAPSSTELSTWTVGLSSGSVTKGDLIETLRRGADNTSNVDPTARLYRAFLGRAPDAGGLKFWIGRKRSGTWSVTKMADSFAASNEFKTKYGILTNRQFVTRIYTDVLGRAADAAGVTYWTGKLDRKERTRGGVMVGFSESNEYKRKQAENTDVAIAHIFLMGRAATLAEATDWVTRQTAGTSQAVLATELLSSSKYATHITG